MPTRLPTKYGTSLATTMPLPRCSRPKCGHAREHGRVGVGGRDELEQLEVARRVEEVRPEEAPPEALAAPLARSRASGCPRCWSTTTASAAHDALDAGHHLALDVEPFDDGLDDAVGAGDAVEVLVEVAEPHARRGAARWKNGDGFILLRAAHAFSTRLLGAPSRPRAAGRHVEQVHGEAGVGAVGGDLRAHGARAEHGDVAKRREETGVMGKQAAGCCAHWLLARAASEAASAAGFSS